MMVCWVLFVISANAEATVEHEAGQQLTYTIQGKDVQFTILEVWNCQAGLIWSSDSPILIHAMSTANSGIPTNEGKSNMQFGSIEVAGQSQIARYQLKGFNRIWSFDLNNESGAFQYAFIIEPDGSASYCDLSRLDVGEETTPSQSYACKKKD